MVETAVANDVDLYAWCGSEVTKALAKGETRKQLPFQRLKTEVTMNELEATMKV